MTETTAGAGTAAATCRRELELEVPAEEVQKAAERIAKEFARVARVPGFRPGKAPVTLIQRRFADDIKSEVLQSVVPTTLEHALVEQKLQPITQPQVEHIDYPEGGGPLKFKASFEVLPEFDLKDYKGIDIEVPRFEITEKEVNETLEQMRERAATFVPVEGRAIQDGDYAQVTLAGMPRGGGVDPIHADGVLCHIGGEETLEPFNEHLRGANVGDKKQFEVKYPDDYPDAKLAGKVFDYNVEVTALKEKRKPELNDEFAKDVDAPTMDELRARIHKDLEAVRDRRQKELGHARLLEKLVSAYDFPVPEALVESQMDSRVERNIRALATQGVDPRAVNVDWAALRERHRDNAVRDVRAELLLDRIALAEKIDATEEEVTHEIEHMAGHTGEAPEVLRARLTKQGALDRIKSKLRSDKTLDWLYQNSRIQLTEAPRE
jgi:trigger factor